MNRVVVEDKHSMAKDRVAEHHEGAKQNEAGITLVPAPSDDPRDPLV